MSAGAGICKDCYTPNHPASGGRDPRETRTSRKAARKAPAEGPAQSETATEGPPQAIPMRTHCTRARKERTKPRSCGAQQKRCPPSAARNTENQRGVLLHNANSQHRTLANVVRWATTGAPQIHTKKKLLALRLLAGFFLHVRAKSLLLPLGYHIGHARRQNAADGLRVFQTPASFKPQITQTVHEIVCVHTSGTLDGVQLDIACCRLPPPSRHIALIVGHPG
mmetsp:Transcript_48954/g.106584  ORF Transcript_48954/g.106584 Transcript_48954/m.106584 type:complete len:223 (+) Transcript_48954:167-835(+)